MATARFLECKVVATINISPLSGSQTIDGVPVGSGESVLLVSQTSGSENGVWTVKALAWERDSNALTQQDFLGMTVVAREGANADTMWQCRNDPTITVGTTALAFARLPGVVDKALLRRLDQIYGGINSTPVVLADADQLLTVAGGRRYVQSTVAALTARRTKTLSGSGAVEGDVITVERTDRTGYSCSFVNGGPAGGYVGVSDSPYANQAFRFDGKNWQLDRALPNTTDWPVFNVRDFGAFGDEQHYNQEGSTVSAAIQACIDAAAAYARDPTHSGAVILFPAGRYVITGHPLIMRRTPYRSQLIYKGAGRHTTWIANPDVGHPGAAGDVFRVETMDENPTITHGGEGHVIEDMSLVATGYCINWDLGEADELGEGQGDGLRPSFDVSRVFFSNGTRPCPSVRVRKPSRWRFFECIGEVVNYCSGIVTYEIIRGSASWINCRGGGAMIRARDSGELYIASCRSEGGFLVPAWDFLNCNGVHLTHTGNEGRGEAPSLYRFKDCKNVVVESASVPGTDRGYVVMMGSAALVPETTGLMRGAPTLTFSHVARTSVVIEQNKIVRSWGSWIADFISYGCKVKFTNSSLNTGWYTIIEATHDTLWVQETIAAETVDDATALAASYQPDNSLQPSITFDASARTITRSAGVTADAGSWVRDGFEVGQTIMTSSPTLANKGPFTVVEPLTDTVLSVAESTIVDEGPLTTRYVTVMDKVCGGITFENCWNFEVRSSSVQGFADRGDGSRSGIEVDAGCRDGRIDAASRGGVLNEVLIDPVAYNVVGQFHAEATTDGFTINPIYARTYWLSRHRMVGLDIEEDQLHLRVEKTATPSGLAGTSIRLDNNGSVGIWWQHSSSGFYAARSPDEATISTHVDLHANRFVGPPGDAASLVARHGQAVAMYFTATPTDPVGNTLGPHFVKQSSYFQFLCPTHFQQQATGYISVEPKDHFGVNTGTYFQFAVGSGVRIKGDATGIGFFGATPVVKPSALTGANNGALNTGDSTSDAIIANMRARINELESRLQALGLLS